MSKTCTYCKGKGGVQGNPLNPTHDPVSGAIPNPVASTACTACGGSGQMRCFGAN